MFRTLEFQNYKAFKHVTIELEPLTIFVGPNGSGKTSILQGLDLLGLTAIGAVREGVIRAPAGVEHLRRRGSDGTLQIRADGWKLSWAGQRIGWHDPQGAAGARINDLTFVRLLRLDATQLAKPSYSEEQRPGLGKDGACLASVLVDMNLRRPETFERLCAAVRSVIPAMQRVRFERPGVLNKKGQPVRGEAIVLDMAGAPDIPAHLVSEGTLITLGIVTVLMSDPSPEVVLLDNLDQGLHPRAQKELIGLLRKLMQQNPKLQILATTHSPYLLDHLDPKEVRLTVADQQGEAHCAKLTDCPDFAKWKDEMTPGEMWSVLGEEWVQKVCCQGAK